MSLLRRELGAVLRRHREDQRRTLRAVAADAGVSLGYLSEVERGRKEASSELLASICAALDVSLADVLREVSDDLTALERPVLAPLGFRPAPNAKVAVATRAGAVAGLPPLPPARPSLPAAPVASLASLASHTVVAA